MIHVPSHNHPGSLCSMNVEPTPGVAAFPWHLPEGKPDLCPECDRIWHICDRDAHRAAASCRNRSHWDRTLELRRTPPKAT